MVHVEPPYPLPPRHAPADLGQRLPLAPAHLLLKQVALVAGVGGYLLFPWAAFAGAVYIMTAEEEDYFFLRLLAFILGVTIGMIALKAWLPRRQRPPYTATLVTGQPQTIAFLERVADDLRAPCPTLWFNSGTVLSLDAPVSPWRLLRGPKWELHFGLWLWQNVNLSECKALLARTLAPLGRGRLERLRLTWTLMLEGYLTGEDAIDELALTDERGSGMARMVRGCFRALTFLMRWNALVCRWLARVPDQELANDAAAVRLCGSDALVHAVFHADFAELQLQKLDDELLACRRAGITTTDVYAHQPDAIQLVRAEYKDDMVGELPILRGIHAGKYVDVYEPGQAYQSVMWEHFPTPAEREAAAKKQFIMAELDERPAKVLLTELIDLREMYSKARYREVLQAPKDMLPFPPLTVRRWLATNPPKPFAPKYGGLYDEGRVLEPGAKNERETALLTDEWTDSRLLSAAATLFSRVAPVVQRWQTARKNLRKLLRRTAYKPARRDRIKINELDDERVKTGKWLAAIDQRAYVIFVHMAARLPDLSLHEELLARYRSVLRFQVFVADAREFADRTGAFAERLASMFNASPTLRRDAAREFAVSRDDFEGFIADAFQHDDPLLLAFTDDRPLAEFLYAHTQPTSFKSDRQGRRLAQAWEEISRKADWLHYLNVQALVDVHERILQAFTTQAAQSMVEVVMDAEMIDDAQVELIDDDPTVTE